MKLRILGISRVAMVFIGRFSWTLARSKGIFMGYLPMKQSNPWKNRNPTISRTEGACKVHIHESLWQNVCVTPWETSMQGYGGDKIFRNFIDETLVTSKAGYDVNRHWWSPAAAAVVAVVAVATAAELSTVFCLEVEVFNCNNQTTSDTALFLSVS